MIRRDKYNGSCNAVDELCTKIFEAYGTKDVKIKEFNMINE